MGLEAFNMNDIQFNGKVAVVTGAGGGLGREYALDLAKRGAKVVVNDLGGARDGSGRDRSAADRVVEEIIRAGGTAIANYDSVSTMAGGASIVDTAVSAYGRIDILVNNAGILRDRSFLKMTEEEWDQVIAVHLKGAFCVTQPALKIMKKNNYGRLVFTSSTSGLYGNFGQTNYGAAKLGLVGLMNSLKLEMMKYNIMVNTVAPNAYSRMTEDIFPADYKYKMRPKFNVPIVIYLCSEEITETGLIFTMNAGWFSRSSIVAGAGVCLGDTRRTITAEEIRERFDEIKSLENAQPYASGAEVYNLCAPLLA
jgi:NAD(P)-dependent dehydrogenase (short-subunit alcohol dehydrogenase family)